MEFLQVLLMLVAVVLIILSLLQGGKSDGLSSAFTGAGDLNLLGRVDSCIVIKALDGSFFMKGGDQGA